MTEENSKFKIPNLTLRDKIGVGTLLAFIIFAGVLAYADRGDCEIARAGYECDTAENVMIENCNRWGEFSCDTSADVSLLQVEWYIGHLCEIARGKNPGLDCSDLKIACNQVVEGVCAV